jgi:hypothetical protein
MYCLHPDPFAAAFVSLQRGVDSTFRVTLTLKNLLLRAALGMLQLWVLLSFAFSLTFVLGGEHN